MCQKNKTKNRRKTLKESKKAEKIEETPTKNTESNIKNTENNGDVFVEGRHFVEHSSIDLFDLWSKSNKPFFSSAPENKLARLSMKNLRANLSLVTRLAKLSEYLRVQNSMIKLLPETF